MVNQKETWSIDSWRNFPIQQQPEYKDKNQLAEVLDKLEKYPPLIEPSETRNLMSQLADVVEGKGFLLHCGDCAESFTEFSQRNIERYFRVVLQMTIALMYGTGNPVVKIGRIAGQFAKPRSQTTETQDGITLPAYRGDIINSMDFNEEARENKPENLLKAYYQSTATLNYLRSLAKGGTASLERINSFNEDFISKSGQEDKFTHIVNRISESLAFMNACRLDPYKIEQLSTADFFISHEGLLLPYEETLTRLDPEDNKYYACSAHMLWIGDRTRNLQEAHVEFFRGIANPIACKVGPSMKEDDLLRLITTLNKDNKPGRLTLISRMGAEKIAELLPKLIRSVKEEGFKVIWSCDPMHGNTIKSPSGLKTRPFNNILSELQQFFAIHKAEGTYAGGVHFEMTGQDVTECLGGAQAISELNLSDRYHTHCDPRLNASQSLELAFLIAETIKKHKN